MLEARNIPSISQYQPDILAGANPVESEGFKTSEKEKEPIRMLNMPADAGNPVHAKIPLHDDEDTYAQELFADENRLASLRLDIGSVITPGNIEMDEKLDMDGGWLRGYSIGTLKPHEMVLQEIEWGKMAANTLSQLPAGKWGLKEYVKDPQKYRPSVGLIWLGHIVASSMLARGRAIRSMSRNPETLEYRETVDWAAQQFMKDYGYRTDDIIDGIVVVKKDTPDPEDIRNKFFKKSPQLINDLEQGKDEVFSLLSKNGGQLTEDQKFYLQLVGAVKQFAYTPLHVSMPYMQVYQIYDPWDKEFHYSAF